MQFAQSFLYCDTASPGGPKRLWFILVQLQFNSDQWSLTQINSFSYKTLLLSFVFIPRVILSLLEHTELLHRATMSLCLVLSAVTPTALSHQSLEIHPLSLCIFLPSFHPLLNLHNSTTI